MKKCLSAFFLITVTVLFAWQSLSFAADPSQTFRNKSFDLGIEGGIWFSGDVYFSLPDEYYTKDSSFLFRAFFDAYVIPQLSFGAFANYSSVEFGDLDVSGTILEFGVSIKPRFFLTPTVAFKPGLNIGYRTLSSSDLSEDAEGLGVNLSLELQFDVGGSIIPFIDAGFLSQPTGGNEAMDITWGPIVYVAGGIAF